MAMSDPLGDMLTRIRNGQSISLESVSMPSSRQKEAIARVLRDEGYIGEITVEDLPGNQRGYKPKQAANEADQEHNRKVSFDDSCAEKKQEDSSAVLAKVNNQVLTQLQLEQHVKARFQPILMNIQDRSI